MEIRECPSCKKKITGNVKKCPNCGLAINPNIYSRITSAKAINISAAIIIVIVAIYAQIRTGERDKPLIANDEIVKIQAETLKDAYGLEYASGDIVSGFNSFIRDEGADSLILSEFVLESGNGENIYRDIKDNISLSIAMPEGRSAVNSVSVLARNKDNNEKPAEFITYCSALMSIFNPTMKADVRQKVLYNMIGYVESEDTPLREKNTYIIVETKYTYAYSIQNGLSLLVEQMPKPEMFSGDLPIR